jgi:hypothetical protein
MADETAAAEPPWKVSINGDAVTGYRVTVWENLCGKFYTSRDFPSRETKTLWGARRVAARMLRRAQKSDDTTIREEIA